MRMMRREDGVAAIEFALIVPLMLIAYVGTIRAGDLLTVYRRTDQVAYTAADLLAQAKSVSTSDVSDVMAAASSILTPYPVSPLSIVLSSVVTDSYGRTKVAWSCAKNGSPRGVGTSFTVPDGTTEAGSSLIVAEVKYAFTPLGQYGSTGSSSTFTMKRTFYARPRRSLTVEKTGSTSCG